MTLDGLHCRPFPRGNHNMIQQSARSNPKRRPKFERLKLLFQRRRQNELPPGNWFTTHDDDFNIVIQPRYEACQTTISTAP